MRWKRAALVPLAALAAVVGVRTALSRPPSDDVPAAPPVPVRPGAAERLADLVRIPTVSQDGGTFDAAAFATLHAALAERFPRVHAALPREVIGGGSLLFTWKGSDTTSAPILLLGHLDVVPADGEGWTHPPFSGALQDGAVWGRGTLDDKLTVAGVLEAVETLLERGQRPRRTVLLAFGHDEEIGGRQGAQAIAKLLQARGVKPLFALDEGLIIADGLMPGLPRPAALIGIAEKGFASVELLATVEGGHSSMPARETAIGVLAAALARLQEQPLPARLDGAAEQLFGAIGPYMPFPARMAMANTWLFRPLLLRQLAARPSTDAMVRTTTAPTIVQGGDKENVLPGKARAVVNFRILPGDTVETVLAHVRAVAADARIAVKALPGAVEPTPAADPNDPAFRTVARTTKAVFPETLVAPSLMIGGTDGRWYANLTPNVYRFVPVRYAPEDLPRLHGRDERIRIADYDRLVQFYVRLLLDADAS